MFAGCHMASALSSIHVWEQIIREKLNLNHGIHERHWTLWSEADCLDRIGAKTFQFLNTFCTVENWLRLLYVTRVTDSDWTNVWTYLEMQRHNGHWMQAVVIGRSKLQRTQGQDGIFHPQRPSFSYCLSDYSMSLIHFEAEWMSFFAVQVVSRSFSPGWNFHTCSKSWGAHLASSQSPPAFQQERGDVDSEKFNCFLTR